MNVPVASLIVAILLPYLWGAVGIPLRKKQLGKLDNNHPREEQAKTTGAAGRALGAMHNAFEALAVYGPSVVAAQILAPASTLAPTLSIVWIVARVLHGITYLANLAPVRSLLFFVGLGCSVALLLVALRVL